MIDEADRFHPDARRVVVTLSAEQIATHEYVLVETIAITQRRLGPVAVRRFMNDLVPALTKIWVDEATHAVGAAALLAALPTDVSLIDFVSFEVMRQHGITRAFTFDDDFVAAGFEAVR